MQLVCGQQMFLTFSLLVVLYMFPLHLHNALKLVLNVYLEFMLVLILHLLLDTLNLQLVMFLRHILMIVILTKQSSRY